MLSEVKKSLRAHKVMDKKDSELYEVIKKLREEIGEMKKVMCTYRSTQPCERKRGCCGCQEQGRGDQSDHCLNVHKVDIFPEGEGDHLQEEEKEDTQLAV